MDNLEQSDEEKDPMLKNELGKDMSDQEHLASLVNEQDILKITITKLNTDGSTEVIWDLQDFLKGNKDKTAHFVRSIERVKN